MLSLVLGLLIAAQAAQSVPATPPVYVPQRVFDTRQRAFIDFERMLADLATADVVFLGEQHDDPNTHRLEAGVVEGLRRRGVRVTLSLEMFERDVQAELNTYLAGGIDEAAFLKVSRPWPRYDTDYRALVETAKREGWPVIAANIPRRYASAVAKSGIEALDSLSPVERSWVAHDIKCPEDAYFKRFTAVMGGHGSSSSSSAAPTADRYYFSQCIKDETMAEAVAFAADHYAPGVVVHVNGSFHSDFGLGTADRVRRRLRDRRAVVVAMLPVTNLDTLAPAGEELTRADYLVYTFAEPRK